MVIPKIALAGDDRNFTDPSGNFGNLLAIAKAIIEPNNQGIGAFKR